MPDPLHPAIVHLPLALGIIMPIVTGLGLIVLYREFLPRASWGAVVLLQGILVATALVAIRTGESEEERVEPHVPPGTVQEHEERAELFFRVAALTLVVAGIGLLDGRTGRSARLVTLPLTIAVFACAISVGRSGGELVYRHGAAAAYTTTAPAATTSQKK